MTDDRKTAIPASGVWRAVGAYTIWGMLPLYLATVKTVPVIELISWRVVFSTVIAGGLVAINREGAAVIALLRRPRVLALLTFASALMAVNWGIYIAAINHGHVFATSFGYYVNPLVNVALGTIFLSERLTRLRWVAVGLAALGVVLMATGSLIDIGIALGLAGTFAIYGLVKRNVPAPAATGLWVETLILMIPALLVLAWQAPAGLAIGRSPAMALLVAASGLFTGIPLIMFAGAAQRLPLSTLGFFQYIAPTLVFILGWTVFGEPLAPSQLAAFAFIWSAVAIFVVSLVRERTGSVAQAPA